MLGRLVVREIRAAGHEAVGLSRASGVDLMDGSGLVGALDGASSVIDVSSVAVTSARRSSDFFTAVTGNLLAAEREAGVAHHVTVSVVGAAAVDAGYYAGKAAQERMLTARRRDDWSLLRATQFHEFTQQLVDRGRVGPVQAVPSMVSQPIAAAEVAVELVDIATGGPRGIADDLAGPREENMADLVRRYLAAIGVRRPVLQVPLPGAWGRGLRDGSTLPGSGARLGRQTFDEWLTTCAV